jgi:cytochrome o ubiquinol oxidase subunit 2
MNEMMHIDAMGGAGKESHGNRQRLEYDNRYAEEGVEAPAATVGGSGRESRSPEQPEGMKPKSNAPAVKPGSAPEHSGHDHSGHQGHGAKANDGTESKDSDSVAPGQLNR